MVTNMLARTGPYANLWAHLKSIHYALVRVLDQKNANIPTELDKDRLLALTALLRDALAYTTNSNPNDPIDSFCTEDYGAALNLRQAIESNEIFKQWQLKSKKTFNYDVERLIRSVVKYIEESEGDLVVDVPVKEFEILRSIVEELLCDAEVALQT